MLNTIKAFDLLKRIKAQVPAKVTKAVAQTQQKRLEQQAQAPDPLQAPIYPGSGKPSAG